MFQIYHIHAHTIRVLDESDLPLQPRLLISLPGEDSAEASGSRHAIGGNKIGEFKVRTGKRDRQASEE
jgi:hypothetical protein